jgi:hypothetical protein
MDKKTAKRIKVLIDKLQRCRRRLSGMKRQPDPDDDPERMRREIAEIEAELRRLRGE